MTRTQLEVIVVHWALQGDLMVSCTNQVGRTKKGTRTSRADTLAFMAFAPVISQDTMKACALEHSPILSLLYVRLLLISLLLLNVWPPTINPPLIFLHSPTHNSYTMPRKRGKSRRGSLYYNALTICNRLDPSQLTLITTSNPDPSHNWPQQPLPPTSNPTIDYGSCPIKEEILPPEELTPPLNFHPKISPLRAHTPDHSFGIVGCIVEEENPPSWKMEIPLIATKANLEMDANLMEEPPPPTTLRLPEEHLQLIFELRQKLDNQAHIQRILGQRMDLLFDAVTEAPTSKRCPTYGQKFVPAYSAHGSPSSHLD
jgi:hypothetical protein